MPARAGGCSSWLYRVSLVESWLNCLSWFLTIRPMAGIGRKYPARSLGDSNYYSYAPKKIKVLIRDLYSSGIGCQSGPGKGSVYFFRVKCQHSFRKNRHSFTGLRYFSRRKEAGTVLHGSSRGLPEKRVMASRNGKTLFFESCDPGDLVSSRFFRQPRKSGPYTGSDCQRRGPGRPLFRKNRSPSLPESAMCHRRGHKVGSPHNDSMLQ